MPEGGGPQLNPDVQALLDEWNREPASDFRPIAEMRDDFRAGTPALGGAGEPVADVRDVAVPTPAGDLPLRLFHPGGDEPLPVVVYLHGGGWVMGGVETYDATLRALANDSGALVAAPEYRLAPEHPFPAARDDCLAAVRWLAGHAAAHGGEPGRLALAGDSAGANLATVLARRLRGEVAIRLQALVYPVVDAPGLTATYDEFAEGFSLTAAVTHRFWALYLDGASPDDPDVAPLRATDLAGVAPAFVVTAEADVLRDEGEAYVRALRAAGVPVEHRRWPGVIHGFVRWQAACGAAREGVRAVAGALARALA